MSFVAPEVLKRIDYEATAGASARFQTASGENVVHIEPQEGGYGIGWATDLPRDAFEEVLGAVVELDEVEVESARDHLLIKTGELVFTWFDLTFRSNSQNEVCIGGRGLVNLELVRGLFSLTASASLITEQEILLSKAAELL